MTWYLIIFVLGHEPYAWTDTFDTQLACDKAAAALILATHEKVHYATTPWTCSQVKP